MDGFEKDANSNTKIFLKGTGVDNLTRISTDTFQRLSGTVHKATRDFGKPLMTAMGIIKYFKSIGRI
jgi:hypothetical protein